MQIHASKKLLDAIPFQAGDSPAEESTLYSWHANLLVIDRRKTLVLMNDQTRYTVVLYGLKAKDFKRLDELIVEAIRETLKAERVNEEVIARYVKQARTVTFHKTKNRSMTARLNRSCEEVWFYSRDLDPAELISTDVSKQVSRLLVGGGKLPSMRPNEEMYKELAVLAGKDVIFSDQVAVLRISMEFENQTIWRRLLVPLDLSFREFHEMMQIVFDWHDSHLHEFYFFEEDGMSADELIQATSRMSGAEPVLNIVSHEEAFSYDWDWELKEEKGLLLSDFIPPHQYMKYVYDLGDQWEHHVVVEKIVKDGSIAFPVCIEGEGTAPPEDCGGEPGFEEFLLVMKDPGHPEYEFMSQWARRQMYSEFDRDLVNRRLKYI